MTQFHDAVRREREPGKTAIAFAAVTSAIVCVLVVLAADALAAALFVSLSFCIGFVPGICSSTRPRRNTCCVLSALLVLAAVVFREGAAYLVPTLPMVLQLTLLGMIAGIAARRCFPSTTRSKS